MQAGLISKRVISYKAIRHNNSGVRYGVVDEELLIMFGECVQHSSPNPDFRPKYWRSFPDLASEIQTRFKTRFESMHVSVRSIPVFRFPEQNDKNLNTILH